MRQRQLRAFRLDDVQVGDEGVVVFHSSVFGVKDSYGTVFDRGCFVKTLAEHNGEFAVTWFHSPREAIGLGVHSEDDPGLRVECPIDLDIEVGRRVYSGLKKGYIDCASISFDVITEIIEDEVTHFKEVRLYESALLTRGFASNPEALVDEVRARTGMEYPKPPPVVITEADLRQTITALSGLRDRDLTEAEQALVAECSVALGELMKRHDDEGQEPLSDMPTDPPSPIGPSAALVTEASDLAAALASRGPIRSPLGAGRTPSTAPGLHALLTEIQALGQRL